MTPTLWRSRTALFAAALFAVAAVRAAAMPIKEEDQDPSPSIQQALSDSRAQVRESKEKSAARRKALLAADRKVCATFVGAGDRGFTATRTTVTGIEVTYKLRPVTDEVFRALASAKAGDKFCATGWVEDDSANLARPRTVYVSGSDLPAPDRAAADPKVALGNACFALESCAESGCTGSRRTLTGSGISYAVRLMTDAAARSLSERKAGDEVCVRGLVENDVPDLTKTRIVYAVEADR